MEEKFRELIKLSPEDYKERAEMEAFFMKKTLEALSSRNQEESLKTAAKFDEFRRKSSEKGKRFYREFFQLLSILIKRKYLDKDEDFGMLDLKEFE